MKFPIDPSDDVEGPFKNLHIAIAKKEHYPAILRLVRESYFKDEPVCKALGNTAEYRNATESMLADALYQDNDQCLVALDQENGEVVAWRISKIMTKAMEEKDAEVLDEIPEGTFKIDMAFVDELCGRLDVFKKFQVDRIVDFKALCVHEKYRGLGLGYELLLRSMRLAKKSGFQIIRGIFSSLYSKRLAVKLGMEQYDELFYKDFTYEGKNVFQNMEDIHTSTILFIKEL